MLTCHEKSCILRTFWLCPESRAGPFFSSKVSTLPLSGACSFCAGARKLARIQNTWLPEGNCHLNTRTVKLLRWVKLRVDISSPWRCYDTNDFMSQWPQVTVQFVFWTISETNANTPWRNPNIALLTNCQPATLWVKIRNNTWAQRSLRAMRIKRHLRPKSPSSQRTGPRTGMFDGDVHLDLLSCIYIASILHRLASLKMFEDV